MSSNEKMSTTPRREGDRLIEDWAHRTIEAFQSDCPEQYEALVETYEGAAASVGVFGIGSCVVSVQCGTVSINPGEAVALTARAAIYPETISALGSGKLTVLEAFHKGDLMVQAEPDELRRAYEFVIELSDAVLRSASLSRLLVEFESVVCRAPSK